MKNRQGSLLVLTLFLLLLFSGPAADAQSPKNPQQDLSVSFSSNYSGTSDPGIVFGTVTNKSANAYPCVRIEFSLGTRYDHAHLGERNRQASVFLVEVQNVSPRGVREYRKALPLPSSIGFESISECSAGTNSQLVVMYDRPNYGGRPKSFGIGRHRLFNEQDFNDLASSIKVPAGLVVVVYEDADQGGGYGRWVDFLEDQPDLSTYNFSNNISFLEIFETQKTTPVLGTTRTITLVYERNSIQNERFVKGHWENISNGKPPNPKPVVTTKPPNVSTPGFCSMSGTIALDRPEYRTWVNLYRPDGSGAPQFSIRVSNKQYKLDRVPEGEYLVAPKGTFPPGEGRSGGLGPSPRSKPLSCKPNKREIVDFKIDSIEG